MANAQEKLAVENDIQASAIRFIADALLIAERPIVSTKFGPESAVLLHMLTRLRPDIPVVWVDTGHNTRATQLFAKHLSERLSLNLSVWRPLDEEGIWDVPSLDDPRHAEFTRQVKLEPFRRAIDSLKPDVWFSSLRREQTAHRAGLTAVQAHVKGYQKVLPLLEWTSADIQAYLHEYDLPSEDNYFDPTKGEAKRECGLHLAF